MEIKAYIDEEVGKSLREGAIKRFGYFKGSLSKSIEEAVIQWLKTNEHLNERIKKITDKAANDPEVIAIFVFGSFAEKKTNYRDVDLAFLLTKDKDELSVLSKYEDYENDPKLDISCLNSLAVNVKKEVLDNGTMLFCKDKSKLYAFAMRTLMEYREFKHVYELMIYGTTK